MRPLVLSASLRLRVSPFLTQRRDVAEVGGGHAELVPVGGFR